jgi:chemotaxis family two-component system response regulator PixG
MLPMKLEKLAEEIQNQGNHDNGEQSILNNHLDPWNFCVFQNKLLYIVDESHRVRRWHRAIRQHCPKWSWWTEFSQLANDKLWECQLLDRGVQKKQISLIQAKLVGVCQSVCVSSLVVTKYT